MVISKFLIVGIPIIIILGLCLIAYHYIKAGENRVAAVGQKAYLFKRFIPITIILIIIFIIAKLSLRIM